MVPFFLVVEQLAKLLLFINWGGHGVVHCASRPDVLELRCSWLHTRTPRPLLIPQKTWNFPMGQCIKECRLDHVFSSYRIFLDVVSVFD